MATVKILSKIKSDASFSLLVWGAKPKVIVIRGCGKREDGVISEVSEAEYERLKQVGLFCKYIDAGKFSVVDEAAPAAPAPEAKGEEPSAPAAEAPAVAVADAPSAEPAQDKKDGEATTGDLFEGEGNAEKGEDAAAPEAPAAEPAEGDAKKPRKRYAGLKGKKEAAAEKAEGEAK